MKQNRRTAFVACVVAALVLLGSSSIFACTDVVVGKDASVDGSTMTSHTVDEGGGPGPLYDCRVRVIPGKIFPAGSTVPIYRQLCEVGPNTPLEKVGEIPQVEKTYTYFHAAYPFMNEHGLTIGETTISQRPELMPSSQAILTVEQLEAIALQRCKTAREAIELIGSLVEKYGFQSSCSDMGECITIVDGKEAWVFEMFGVGPFWLADSGEPGAIWAARRVPDDEVCVVPNVSRIGVIDETSPNFIVCKHCKDIAIENGWYDPNSGKPFSITEAYTAPTGYWSAESIWTRNRLWYIYSLLCPSQQWDHDAPLSSYPFSVKAEKKVSVQDIIAFQRSAFEGTDRSLSDLPQWFVPDGNGGKVKSPLATPFINSDLAALLGIQNERPIARYKSAHGWVAQVRDFAADPVRTCLWYYSDNPTNSLYVPMYNGVTELPASWGTCDKEKYSRDSAWWAFATVDLLASVRYQEASKDIVAARGPVEADFFATQPAVEKMVADLAAKDPAAARSFITSYTATCLNRAENLYWDLADLLFTKYNNNRF
ncbi:MAG TPA: C69 family dipeptidase [Bacillota bacterium]|nr:C69 family dipeptidase [Bacillota bacterium]